MSRIWSVGGGKGGTGKTFLSASLGIFNSRKTEKTYLVDADLGAPNLHTFVGLKSPKPNLGDFIVRKLPGLEAVVSETSFPGLRLVSGPSEDLFVSNLKYFQKTKLLAHIRRLSGLSIVDVGAGTDFNTLDFFLLSDVGVVVLTPDPASVENAYHFLRSAVQRILERTARRLGISELLTELVRTRRVKDSVPDLVGRLGAIDRGCGDIMGGALSRFSPNLVINRAPNQDVGPLRRSIRDAVEKQLGIQLFFAGTVPDDPNVSRAMCRYTPYVANYPHSPVATSIQQIRDWLWDCSSQW